MSSPGTNGQGNIKNVMRTALVGIKPADQVILKGYLRVLLRLEADLEWVSANHPQVDLFLINHEFRQSNNVMKLLSNQSDKPVLYTTRVKSGEGWIKDDVIALPLKQMQYFSDWLAGNVSVLSNLSISNIDASTTDLMDDSDSIATNVNDISNAANNVSSVPVASSKQAQKSISAENTKKFTNLIEVIKRLQQRQSELFQICVADQPIAIAQTSSGRLWKSHDDDVIEKMIQSVSMTDWTVNEYDGSQPDVIEAVDLKQWLWDVSWDRLDDVLPLISMAKVYKLRYWVKPRRERSRTDVLGIMTAIEKTHRNIHDVADVSRISLSLVHRTIAGLLFSGHLQIDSYELLKVNAINIDAVSGGYSDTATSNSSQTKLSTIDSVMSRRAGGGSVSHSTTSEIPLSALRGSDAAKERSHGSNDGLKSKTDDNKKPEKMGFLSRLRRKLGL